jgi:hypothetical protein
MVKRAALPGNPPRFHAALVGDYPAGVETAGWIASWVSVSGYGIIGEGSGMSISPLSSAAAGGDTARAVDVAGSPAPRRPGDERRHDLGTPPGQDEPGGVMSDTSGHQGGTQPLTRPAQDHDVDGLRLDADDPTGGHRGQAETDQRSAPNPVAVVKDPDNRAKLLLAIGVLTLLNFLLLLGVLASVTDRHDQVMVDGTACIIGEREGEGVLFCQQ